MTSDSASGPEFRATAKTLDDVTFVIKTFLRPGCAHRLIDSIVAKYPGARILVADDSPAPISRENVTVFHLPFDCGVGYGRNYLVDRVPTPFFVMCDDDIVITGQTNIEQMIQPLRDGTFDLVSARFMNGNRRFVWEGVFERSGDVLVFRPGDRGQVDGIYRYDMCHQFFVANTQKVRDLRWDDDLKVNDHTDFFLRGLGRIRVGFDPRWAVSHRPEYRPEYARFRDRRKEFRALFMRKHGLRVYRNEVSPNWRRQVIVAAALVMLVGAILAIRSLT